MRHLRPPFLERALFALLYFAAIAAGFAVGAHF
jgi:hypothetical protein